MPVSINGNGSVVGVTSVTGAGMDLIVPTSVAGAGVTLNGGQISFTAATTVNVNGCFTAIYDNYVLLMDVSAASAVATLSMRVRLAGTDASTAYFTSLVYSQFNSDTGAFTGSGNGTTGFTGLYNDTSGGAAVVNIFSPALARKTIFTAHGGNFVSNGNGRTVQGQHTTATAYDGISLLPASGNLTGSLRVYGMRNS
jgi:hypothetical protein